MSNLLFDPGREGFLAGEIDYDTAVIKTALARGYTFSAAHKFVSDVTGAGGSLVATPAALASKTITSGVADADDVTFTGVGAGAAIGGILVCQSSTVTNAADVAATAQRVWHVVRWLLMGSRCAGTDAGHYPGTRGDTEQRGLGHAPLVNALIIVGLVGIVSG
jgi:hypothetical protein